MSEPAESPSESGLVATLRNLTSIAGALLATISVLLFLVFFVGDLVGLTAHSNPYIGIVFFIVLPSLFVVGLLIIPLGVYFERRRLHAGRPPSLRHWPRLDLNDARVRSVVFAVVVLTPVNLMIVSTAAYKGVEEMDSPQFCGAVCHEVMEPEYTAYQNGPHSKVNCVACHIGPGAGWFVRSKMSGLRQVVAVAFNTHSRPIESPVHNLRPAMETCAQCHWPTKFHGDKIETKHEFAEDEANTESVTTLRLRIGGTDGAGKPTGIHWHVAEQNVVEYVALDENRQKIGYVKWTAGRRQDARVLVRRRHRRAAGGRRAPAHGLRGLPQPPEPHLRALGGSRHQRGHGGGRRGEGPAVHPPRGGRGAQGGLSRSGDGQRADRQQAHDVLQGRISAALDVTPGRHRAERQRASGPARPQRVPCDEAGLGPPSRQPRPHGVPGVLPLS